ncbi:histidine acid phosphatase [Phlyctema vagabunda]|uniref:Histidine acid phosphatase n=1 Tax=Phlyctema vagabunda TaxID=108571 RepID=A0ABR4P9F4_9HELO
MGVADEKPSTEFPLAGVARDGWSKDGEATATCFCGAVQLAFPTEGPGFIDVFVCNCTDCRKITASMFATNITIEGSYVKHLRGQENLTKFTQNRTTATGNDMSNYFCSTCGSLMYRITSGLPSLKILRLGTVDDFSLHETKLRPTIEQFIPDRVAWLQGLEGVEKFDKMH